MTFSYKVRTVKGGVLQGTLEANDQRAAVDKLRAQQYIVLEITEQQKNALMDMLNSINPMKPHANAKDIVIFSRQLAVMINAGVPIVQAIAIIGDQIENPYFKEIIGKIREDIEGGTSIADALGKHPDCFDTLYVNMARAGELGGILDVILERLSTYLEAAQDLRSKVKGALMYPIVVVVISFGVTMFLMVFVIPAFKEVFSSFGSNLPLPTQIMINASDFLKANVLFIVGGIIILFVGFSKFAKSEAGRKFLDPRMLKLPVLGPLLIKTATAKFTRTFGTLVKSGVPILSAMETVAKTSGNWAVEDAVMTAREAIREGEKIAEPLAKSGIFPPMVNQMVKVGEETGNLDTMLTKIADFYDSEVDTAVKAMTSLIEPLVIVFLGIVVGAIVIAMYLPIFEMGSLVSEGG
ncbi:MAG: pilus assembly protein PilC [Elusimicrobia bacterium CG08_land_8_20_14_0_20_44_26]|nr:MAG: pilus assembly protein PilC [Elusimicrobia bacterium CG08_land_8_20_14_0_20_44_26]